MNHRDPMIPFLELGLATMFPEGLASQRPMLEEWVRGSDEALRQLALLALTQCAEGGVN